MSDFEMMRAIGMIAGGLALFVTGLAFLSHAARSADFGSKRGLVWGLVPSASCTVLGLALICFA